MTFDYHENSWVSHNSELTEHHDDKVLAKRWQQGSKARVRHVVPGFSVLVSSIVQPVDFRAEKDKLKDSCIKNLKVSAEATLISL